LIGGVTLQAGQELHIFGKASEVINNGDAVMFAGSQGDHILLKKAVPSEINTNPEYFIGIATQDFIINQFGYVTTFGKVRTLDTTIYSGAVLYFDSTSASSGKLTDTIPEAPNAKIIVAAVLRVHATQGVLMVRPHTMPKINDLQNVKITAPANKQSLFYNESTSIWENRLIGISDVTGLQSSLDGKVPTSRTLTINGVSFDLSANRSWSIPTHDAVTIGTANGLSLSGQQLSLGLASASSNGALSASDWSTFNNKQNALTNPITGTGTLNYISKFTASGSIGDSQIYDNGFQIGIGLTNPSAKFHVNGLSILTNPNADNYNENIRLPQSNAGYASITLGGAVASSGTSIQQWTILKDLSNNFMIRHYNTDHLFINTDGNVGLGTSNAWFPASGRKILSLNGTGSSLLEFHKGGVLSGYIYSTDSLLEISGGDSAPQTFLTSNTERMRITTGGNIGIFTSSPNYTLDVNGFIGASRIYPYNSNNTYITGDGNAGMAVVGNGYLNLHRD